LPCGFSSDRGASRRRSLTGYSLKNRGAWITKHTMLRGEPFSFKGHEYQLKIISLECEEALIRKCSQIGLSELPIRDSLAMVNVMPGFTVIYTLPTAAFSKTFARTRVDPMIELAGPEARAPRREQRRGEAVRRFLPLLPRHEGHDGRDLGAGRLPRARRVRLQRLEVLSTYQSRLTHSPYKWKRKFSTPTINGWGISAEFDVAEQHWNMVKCKHCNLHFLPDYFQHVIVPGWDEDLREINADNLHTTRYREAQLHCPGCGKVPSLDVPEHREWVIKNPDNNNGVVAVQIQPFDAPRSSRAQTHQGEHDVRALRRLHQLQPGPSRRGQGEQLLTKEELEALFTFMGRFTPWANVMGIDSPWASWRSAAMSCARASTWSSR
jgi:hypothetical protein